MPTRSTGCSILPPTREHNRLCAGFLWYEIPRAGGKALFVSFRVHVQVSLARLAEGTSACRGIFEQVVGCQGERM